MALRVLDYGDEVCYEFCRCISCRLKLIENEIFFIKNGLASKHRESPV